MSVAAADQVIMEGAPLVLIVSSFLLLRPLKPSS